MKKIQPDLQLGIFKTKREDALEQFNIAYASAQQWYKSGYLSFKIEKTEELEAAQLKELAFLNAMFNSGVSLNTIDVLLGKLGKPYAYSLSQIYYDFTKGEWKQLPAKEDFVEENNEDLLSQISSIVDEYEDSNNNKAVNEILDSLKALAEDD